MSFGDARDMREITDQISYLDWECLIEGGDPYLVWEWWGECAVTGDMTRFRSRKWRLSKHMTESELVQTAFAALLAATEHEARENFHYEGERPFHPHVDIRALMEASRKVSVRA